MIYLQNVDVIERAKVAQRNNVISTSPMKPHLQAQFMDYSDGQCTSPTRKLGSSCTAQCRVTGLAQKVIRPTQSAFIPRRNILKGVVVLHETIHHISR
jgi:hypothetical protein